jgi:hypothetical protein
MTNNIVPINSDTSDLLDSWAKAEMDGVEFLANLHLGTHSDSAFTFALRLLSEINAKSRLAVTGVECRDLDRRIGQIERWRRSIALPTSHHHDIVIEMCDATRVSVVHTHLLILKPQKAESGRVYFLLNKKTGLVKIGWSINLPSRIKVLNNQGGETLELLGSFAAKSMKVETEVHRKFKGFRVIGEWFKYEEGIQNFILKKCNPKT